MKKRFATAFMTLATAFGFAQEGLPEQQLNNVVKFETTKPALPSIETKVTPATKSFGYLRMGVSDSQLPTNGVQMVPGLGIGYRLASGSSAIDISASFNRREVRTDEGKERAYAYTLPKANYLYYVSPARDNSLYAGGGLAWGGVRSKDGREFLGLIPNVAVGYEMNRNATLHSFVQLDVSQPAIAASQRGDLAPAFAELSLGAGF